MRATWLAVGTEWADLNKVQLEHTQLHLPCACGCSAVALHTVQIVRERSHDVLVCEAGCDGHLP